MFLKFEIQSVKRNRNTHENRLNWSKGIGQESKEPETFKRRSYFSPLHFDQSKNKLDQSNYKETKILKKSWKNFLQNHLKNCFYDMAWMFMTSNDLQNQNFQRKIQLDQISSLISLLTPKKKCVKCIKNFKFVLGNLDPSW